MCILIKSVSYTIQPSFAPIEIFRFTALSSMALLMLFSDVALASSGLSGLTKAVQAFVGFVTSGFGVLLLTLIIMGVGIAVWFSKLTMQGAFIILGGAFLVFGAPRIAVWVQGLFV